MTDLEKLSKFSQEDVKRVSEQDIVIVKLPRQTLSYWWSTWRWEKHHNK